MSLACGPLPPWISPLFLLGLGPPPSSSPSPATFTLLGTILCPSTLAGRLRLLNWTLIPAVISLGSNVTSLVSAALCVVTVNTSLITISCIAMILSALPSALLGLNHARKLPINVTMRLTNGSNLISRVAFGCGYNQHHTGPISPPPTVGVLGLGNGKASIISQLSNLGVIRNVLGHCLSSRGGGFLFLGNDLVSPSKVAWTPVLSSPSVKHYLTGPADIIYNGMPTGVKGLQVIFDSGSSYTYLNSKAYQAILVKADITGKPLKEAAEDNSLPICWKGAKPFKSISEIRGHFKPVVLSFTNSKVQLPLLPDAYLIISKLGNVCLGILNGAEVKLGDLNVIGDISLQDKVVIYDNEKRQIGWAPANCNRLPSSDLQASFLPYVRKFLKGTNNSCVLSPGTNFSNSVGRDYHGIFLNRLISAVYPSNTASGQSPELCGQKGRRWTCTQ
ncbi:hypothetical protein MLD38_000451 [Melastoma candidum]|uniref:Uncharacterized protein n=1 Tax=Melastoma candidum TaxID=119954 RepID=A0ACB9SDE7_9MYRT|nr:hypothetical protein MLD38_000451 [Melastoma candidum]